MKIKGKNATQKLPPRDYDGGPRLFLSFSTVANPSLVPRHDAHKLPIKTCSGWIYYTRRYFTLQHKGEAS